MKNTIVTIVCFAALAVIMLGTIWGTTKKVNDEVDRVAALEQRVNELNKVVDKATANDATASDAIIEIRSEIKELHTQTDAIAETITTEETTEEETTEESTTEESAEDEGLVFSATKDDGETSKTFPKDEPEEEDEWETHYASEDEKDASDSSGGIFAGYFELTAYCATGNPCADGVYPSVGYTVACNDSRLWHHWISIEGYGVYYCHDTGGMACNVIDIFMGSYDECISFGRQGANVYIID